MEREAGIEPASLAWKAKVLPLNYSRVGVVPWPLSTSDQAPLTVPPPSTHLSTRLAKPLRLLEETWWRRLDSNQRRRKPTDLQSAPFSHSGTPPRGTSDYSTIAGVDPISWQATRWAVAVKRCVASTERSRGAAW